MNMCGAANTLAGINAQQVPSSNPRTGANDLQVRLDQREIDRRHGPVSAQLLDLWRGHGGGMDGSSGAQLRAATQRVTAATTVATAATCCKLRATVERHAATLCCRRRRRVWRRACYWRSSAMPVSIQRQRHQRRGGGHARHRVPPPPRPQARHAACHCRRRALLRALLPIRALLSTLLLCCPAALRSDAHAGQ